MTGRSAAMGATRHGSSSRGTFRASCLFVAVVLAGACERDQGLSVEPQADASVALDLGVPDLSPVDARVGPPPDLAFCPNPRVRPPVTPAPAHFPTSNHYAGTDTLLRLRAVDLDGDRKLDVVAAGVGAFSWFRGNGDGTMQPIAVVPNPGGWTVGLVVGDFDGDHRLDVVIADDRQDGSSSLATWLNQGAGAFVAGPRTATVIRSTNTGWPALQAGDWNGDGKLDVIGTSLELRGTIVTAYLGQGDGSFRPSTPLRLGDINLSDRIDSGDLDEDGRPDVVVAGPDANVCHVLLSRGDGTFVESPGVFAGLGRTARLADWNGDGHLDLLSGETDLGLGRGDGTFSWIRGPLQVSPDDVAATDLDGDGRLDEVALTELDELSLVRGDGTGHFVQPIRVAAGAFAAAFATGDFDEDGRPDFAVSHRWPDRSGSSQLSILLGDGSGDVRAARSRGARDAVMTVLAGDHDRDGKLDLVAATRSGITIWSGATAAPIGSTGFLGVWSAVQGDWDGDGALDVATALFYDHRFGPSGNVTIVRGDNKGHLATAQELGGWPAYCDVASADLDSDGDADLVAANHEGELRVFLNRRGTFLEEDKHKVGGIPTSLALADLTGDGRLDVAAALYDQTGGPSHVAILEGRGDGRFDPPAFLLPRSLPHHLAAGDLDGDGRADLVVSHPDGIDIYRVDCHGQLALAKMYPVLARSVTIADVNNDQLPDLVLALSRAHAVDGDVSFGCDICPNAGTGVLLGRGDGSFTGLATWPTGAGARQVAVADLDGDGWPELVTAHSTSQIVTVLHNQH